MGASPVPVTLHMHKYGPFIDMGGCKQGKVDTRKPDMATMVRDRNSERFLQKPGNLFAVPDFINLNLATMLYLCLSR